MQSSSLTVSSDGHYGVGKTELLTGYLLLVCFAVKSNSGLLVRKEKVKLYCMDGNYERYVTKHN